MKRERLYESPFTDIDSHGPDGVSKSEQVDRLAEGDWEAGGDVKRRPVQGQSSMNSQPPSFFTTLGALAKRQQENQLSRTFKACFDNSAEFRKVVVGFAAERLGTPSPMTPEWACNVEQPVRGKRGRLDLYFRRVGGDESFAIESKVEAPLDETQLSRYRRAGVRRLLIATKYPAEVSERRLRKLGVAAFRWQEIHDLLSRRRKLGPVDRFLFKNFAAYLREAGMAYPNPIRTVDLKHMARCFRGLAGDSEKGFRPRTGFETASRCLDILGLVAQSLRDRYEGVEGAAQWGPGYYNTRDDKGLYHYLAVTLYRKPWTKNYQFFIQIVIPNDGDDLRWSLEYYEGSDDAGDKWTWETLQKVGIRRGVLDREALLENTLKWAKRWKVQL